uniref:NR LBD domain-containing protein n=1 Tax=Panagrellus redivivus TaxID=6233 RepID=A0A7E4V6C5_PANRE
MSTNLAMFTSISCFEIEQQCMQIVYNTEPSDDMIVFMTPEEATYYLMQLIERIDYAVDAQDGLRHCIAAKRVMLLRLCYGQKSESLKLNKSMEIVNRFRKKFWNKLDSDFLNALLEE